jgi:hypothetical protein
MLRISGVNAPLFFLRDYRHGATHHTNHVELFWKLFKYSVRSTHIHISAKLPDHPVLVAVSGE